MVEFTPTIVFAIILLSVPLQFYLSPSSMEESNYYIHRVVNEIKKFYDRFVEIKNAADVDDDVQVEHDITEEIDEIIENKKHAKSEELDHLTSYFGGSHEPRDPRSPNVQYYVGQVIRHKIHNYRGVIIAWDEKGNAPDWWIKRVHKDLVKWKEMPNYTVIIDTRDRLIPQIAYVTQENITPSHGSIIHPLVKHYFERLKPDGQQYLLRPWHRKIYPNG